MTTWVVLESVEFPIEAVAKYGTGAIFGTAMAWMIYRVFPAVLARIDKIIEDTRAEAAKDRVAAQARDDARLKMFFDALKDIRDEDARRRHDERDGIQEAFAAFSLEQGRKLDGVSEALRELAEAVKAQGVRP